MAAVPFEQIAQPAFVGFRAGGNKRAAENAALFMDNGHMAAQLQNTRRLHPADPAADDMDGLRAGGFFDIMLVPLHRFGVYGAACKVKAVRKLLIVRNALVMAHIEAAVVAEYAGADILRATLGKLFDPFPIGKELPRKAGAVQPAGGYFIRGGRRVEPAGADNRDIHKVFDMLGIRKIAVFGHIYRRVRPIPCVICAVIAVQAIVAGILQVFRGTLGFLHIAADLGIFLAGERALTEALCFGNDTVPQRNREILAARLFYRADYLHREAVAVFERAAVFVRALVDIFKRELIEQIALVHGMNLNAVHARLLQKRGTFCKGFHKFVYFGHGHLPRGDFIRPAVGRRAGGGGYFVQIHKRLAHKTQEPVCVKRFHHFAHGEGAPEPRGELDKELCAGGVQLRHPFLQIAVHFFVFVQPLPEHRVIYRLAPGHNEPRAVFGDFKDKFRPGGIKVIVFHPAEKVCPAHACQHKTVFDLAFADLPRREQRFKSFFHAQKPSEYFLLHIFYHRGAQNTMISRSKTPVLCNFTRRTACAD